MRIQTFQRPVVLLLALAGLGAATLLPAAAQAPQPAGDPQPVVLPAPETEGGMPLLSAIAARRSQRTFAPDPLPLPVLSTMLWAAWGVTRPETGHRAAPSARNRQQTDLYVFLPEGVYRYDGPAHLLQPVLAGDHRGLTGRQDFVAQAPVNLVYVERMPEQIDEDALVWAGSHAGFISENVYLFCASAGLATVVRGWVDREALAGVLDLPPGHRILLAQSVGYPGG
jgi:nitroreductase